MRRMTTAVRLLACDEQRSTYLRGSLVQSYTVYGYLADMTSLSGFTGQAPDVLSGGYLLGSGYRLYSPSLMRFTAPDSWSPFEESTRNAYAYCEADPVNHVDPSGHAKNSVFQVLRGAGKIHRTIVPKPLAKTAARVLDSVLFHGVDALHGKRIMSKAPESRTPAENVFFRKRIARDLQLARSDAQLLRHDFVRARKGKEGAKIIFDEAPSYIANKVQLELASKDQQIARLERAESENRSIRSGLRSTGKPTDSVRPSRGG